MIFDRIFASGPEARLLPAEKLHGPTVAVMAIMTFAMLVVAAAGLALAHSASAVGSAAENRYVVELPAASAARLPGVAAAASALPQVSKVTTVPQSEMRRTLRRWLGEGAASADLPLPAMATVELAPNADPSAVAAAVRKQAPEATMTPEATELKPLLGSIRGLQWLALSLVVLMVGATAAAIVLAARGALDTHRSTVEIMHGIGATDAQLVRLFERKIAADSIFGAMAGSLAAGAVLLLLGGGFAAAAGNLASAPLGLPQVAILIFLPVAAVAIAVAVAHWTLLRALRATL